MTSLQHLGTFLIGTIVGFLGGLFGKGGSAIATPMLSLIGIPGYVAVAAPLPATVPGTLVASIAYQRERLLDWHIVGWSLAVGVPATVLGSSLTEYTGATPLLVLTGILVFGFGVRFLFAPRENLRKAAHEAAPAEAPYALLKLVLVSAGVGLFSGLLANSGGFLLAPSYARILRRPLKVAFACSLTVSIFLAVPATLVHAYLGHIDWRVTGWMALGSVPLSYAGAKLAIHTSAVKLERWYGLALTVLGILFLFKI